jgi:hypothetical protein
VDHGIVAGFGALIGRETLDELRARGFSVVRQDVQRLSPTRVEVLAAELSEANITPLWIVGDSDVLEALPDGSLVEWGNEPDIGSMPPADYAETLRLAYGLADGRLRLSPGPISNLNERGLDFLRSIIALVPEDMPVAVHRYPRWPGPQRPHTGFGSRAAEVVALRSIIGTRDLWMTETGYHTGRQRSGFWCWQQSAWTETQVVEFAAWERDFWRACGASIFCWYQLHDDPRLACADYGIRRADGTWKPVADVFEGTL